ncbi:MAG: VapC toxin family PIN domain ribonuclease [Ilumatobacteraceae bacterium]
MPEQQLDRGILDTSVVIDLERLGASQLPREVAVTSITMAELAAGPHATATLPSELDAKIGSNAPKRPSTRSRSTLLLLAPTGGSTPQSSRKVARPEARAVDLLIAAVAATAELPLCTRNPDDFSGLDDLVTVVSV